MAGVAYFLRIWKAPDYDHRRSLLKIQLLLINYPTERRFSLKKFKKNSMIPYTTKITNQNLLTFNFVNLTMLHKVAVLNSVYIFIL